MAIPEGMSIDNFLREIAKRLDTSARRIEFYLEDFPSLSQEERAGLKRRLSDIVTLAKADLDEVLTLFGRL